MKADRQATFLATLTLLAGLCGSASAAPTVSTDAVAGQDLLGCWSYSQTDEPGLDYSSICFVDGGIVETVTGGGTVKGGLSGTSDGGTYAIDSTEVRFESTYGGYGWPWADAKVTCTVALSQASQLVVTACSDGGADRTFERRVVEEDAAD